jgi:hypothetical protein
MRWWSGERGRRRASRPEPPQAEALIDLRDQVECGLPALPEQQALRARLAARRQAELTRAEAQRELAELRQRHWSADRIYEESRLGIEWWEHPKADPHAVLGLLPGDGLDDATRARRALARTVHPDVVADEDGDRGYLQMAAVNGAFDRMRRALASLPEEVPDRTPTGRPSGETIALGRGTAAGTGAAGD